MASTLDRRKFLQSAAAGLTLGACAAPPETPGASRPNIVMIMSDDMGYSDLGCYGGEIPTPHLDRLGFGGMRLTRYYTNNMCVPTRAALMTGIQNDVSLRKGVLHARAATVAQALQRAGYHTLMSGKWHLANAVDDTANTPRGKGFDRYYGMLFGSSSFFQPYGLMRDDEDIFDESMQDDYYITDALSDNAVSFLRDAENDERPFFLYLSYTAAHWPLHAFERDIEPHKGKYADGWDALRERRHARMKELGVVPAEWPLSPRHPDVPAWADEPRKAWQQRRMEVYAAQVDVMDRGIGRVVAEIERQGKLDNTLICFQVDNGGCHVEYTEDRKHDSLYEKTRDGRPIRPGNIPDLMPGPEDTWASYGYGWANASNTPFRLFKQFDHEGGIMSPFIAHWPGVIPVGTLSDQVGHVIDLAPTFLEVAGVEPSAEADGGVALPMDGRSLLPVLQGGRREPPAALYWEFNHGRAVRQGKWKLVAADQGAWELYDVEADGTELNDLAAAMPEKAEELARLWEGWKARGARL